VAEQVLDSADVVAVAHQLGGEAVAQRVNTLLINRSLSKCVITTTPSSVTKWRSFGLYAGKPMRL
jgi:hypothetical protein